MSEHKWFTDRPVKVVYESMDGNIRECTEWWPVMNFGSAKRVLAEKLETFTIETIIEGHGIALQYIDKGTGAAKYIGCITRGSHEETKRYIMKALHESELEYDVSLTNIKSFTPISPKTEKPLIIHSSAFEYPPGWLIAWQLCPHCPGCHSDNLEKLPPDAAGAILSTEYECLDCSMEITNIHNLALNYSSKEANQ